MLCKACKSENVHKFETELTASLTDLNGLKVPPVYVCQSALICLDCGFTELVVPTNELRLLKRGKAAPGP